jgi:ABC-type Fe3+/spermidine/putrescine transport system ATPase subunit
MSTIEFQNVSKRYGEKTVVQDLSFQIHSAERIILHGPSGCGKTTVLRLMAGFLAPDAGTIRIRGQEVAAQGRILTGAEHRKLGMVFQDLALWPHLTVSQNLDFALQAQGLSRPIRSQRITEMLACVRLTGMESHYPTKLSGGQQQRVAIARALVSRPLALLMDEPLSHLDDKLKEELCCQLLDLQTQLGFTLVYVTHNKEEMQHLGTRTILLPEEKEAPQSTGSSPTS